MLRTQPEQLNETEGFTGIVFCAIASDGMITQEEMDGLASALGRMRLYRTTNRREFGRIMDKLQRHFSDNGFDATLQACANAVTPPLRETAFAVATDLLFADGVVSQEERVFLEKMQDALKLDEAAALRIVEVVQIKNRG